MADHARKQIRDAAVTALTGLTTTAARVYPQRRLPVDRSQLPALLIYTPAEEVSLDGAATMGAGSARKFMRGLTLVVEVLADPESASVSADDLVDRMCAEVETALGADRTLGGLVKDCWLQATEEAQDDAGAVRAGVAQMTWAVTYRTAEGDPTTLIQ